MFSTGIVPNKRLFGSVDAVVPLEQILLSHWSNGSSIVESTLSIGASVFDFSECLRLPSEAPREIRLSTSGTRRFVLVLEDCLIITSLVNYWRPMTDLFRTILIVFDDFFMSSLDGEGSSCRPALTRRY